MFIHTEETPNPNSLKFVLDHQLAPLHSFDFTKQSEAQQNPFANDIFKIEGIERVFILDNFITITKSEVEWDIIKPQVLSLIMDYISSNRKIINTEESTNEERKFDDEIEQEIYNIIKERVEPAVAMDGGSIEFVKFDKDEGVVYVSMHGACSGCPSSSATLKDGIKRTLQYYVPEVIDVIQV